VGSIPITRSNDPASNGLHVDRPEDRRQRERTWPSLAGSTMSQYSRTPVERAQPDGDGFVVEVPAKN
jgi:hypothetical protein